MKAFIGDSPIVAHAYENERDFLNYEFARAKAIAWGDSAYPNDTQMLYAQLFRGASQSLTAMLR